MNGPKYLQELAASGRYHFTLREAAKALDAAPVPIWAVLRCLIRQLAGQHVFVRGSHYGAWQIYGHSYGHLPPIGKQWDVGVDNNEFRPVSFDELKAIMAPVPDRAQAGSEQ